MVIPLPSLEGEYDSIKNSLNTDSYSVTHLTFRRRSRLFAVFLGTAGSMTDMFFNMNIQRGKTDSVTSTRFNEDRRKSKIAYNTYYNPYSSEGLFSKNIIHTESAATAWSI